MLEVIDYTECSRIFSSLLSCYHDHVYFTSMISIICHYIVSVPVPSVVSQIDSPHGARSLELGMELKLVVNMWLTWWTVISSTQASWGTNVFAYARAVSVTRMECSLQAGFSHTGLHSLWTLCLDGLSVLVGIVSTCFIPSSKQANITVSVLSMAWLYQVRTWEPKSPRLSIVSQWSRTSPMSGGVSGILWYLPACSRHEVGLPATRNSGWAQAS